MAAILKTVNKVSNFLAREQWRDRNWCRKDVQVDLTGLAALDPNTDVEKIVQVGMVVMLDTSVSTTKWVIYNDGAFNPAEDQVGIIVDERVGDPVFFNGTDMDGNNDATLGYGKINNMDWGTTSTSVPTLAILVKGDAIVRTGGLITPVVTSKLVPALNAQNIETVSQLSGLYSTDRKRPFRAL